MAYCSEQNGKGQQVLCQLTLVLLTVHGEVCTQWVSGLLQLVDVLQVQHMVLVALPGWQVGVWCSRSYICGDMLVGLNGIQVTLTYVVKGMLILSTANDLDNVQSMVCCMDDSGREPQASCIIENRYRLSGKQWGFLLTTLMVVVCCTQGGMLV